MKGYTGVLDNGQAIHYVDKKRWFWNDANLHRSSGPLEKQVPGSFRWI